MHVQSQSSHHAPLVDVDRERGGTHDKDGYVLSAHRGKSQGRPRTTSSSQLISQNGLPDRISQQGPMSPEPKGSRQARTAVSSPDNGKQFTDRFGRGGEVLFDKICRRNGITHRLTAPRSPTTPGEEEGVH